MKDLIGEALEWDYNDSTSISDHLANHQTKQDFVYRKFDKKKEPLLINEKYDSLNESCKARLAKRIIAVPLVVWKFVFAAWGSCSRSRRITRWNRKSNGRALEGRWRSSQCNNDFVSSLEPVSCFWNNAFSEDAQRFEFYFFNFAEIKEYFYFRLWKKDAFHFDRVGDKNSPVN